MLSTMLPPAVGMAEFCGSNVATIVGANVPGFGTTDGISVSMPAAVGNSVEAGKVGGNVRKPLGVAEVVNDAVGSRVCELEGVSSNPIAMKKSI
jgi:hypothetical protein